jgi:superfamily II DNA helicase RecQ
LDPYVALDRKRATKCPYAKQLVVQRTGAGKSALVHITATLLGGCTLIISPLLVLGNDLAKKVTERVFGAHIGPINVILLDDYSTPARAALARRHLFSLPPPLDGRATTFIIASPQCIAAEDKQYLGHAQTIIDLHKAGILSFVVLDEIQFWPDHGLTFRNPFVALMKRIWTFIFPADRPLCHPRLLMMTATFDLTRFEYLEKMLGFKVPIYDICITTYA